MTSVKVFDPAMCCSSGVCGPSVDPQLARFAADLDWLAGEGVSVERFNLAQQPEAFVAHDQVTDALRERGEGALPLILVDDLKVIEGAYPSRDQLARWAAAVPGGTHPDTTSTPVTAGTATGGEACGCGEGGC